MKTIVVIPTYNESENINPLFDEIFNNLPNTHILIVDDNSPDGTADIVKKRMLESNHIHLIHRPGKMGLGTAYCDGFRWALENDFEIIFEMDADFSHNPKDLPRMLNEIENYDTIIGSRYIVGVNVINWPLRRLILSYGASIYTRIITGMPIKDTTAGFICYKASILKKIDIDSIKTNGYGFQIEMKYRIWKNKGKIKEIPIIFIDRLNGVSKMNRKIFWEAIFLVWKLRFSYKSIKKQK